MKKIVVLFTVLCISMAAPGFQEVDPDSVLFLGTGYGQTTVREGTPDSVAMGVRYDTLVVDSIEFCKLGTPQVDCDVKVTFRFRYEPGPGYDTQIVVTESNPFRRGNYLRPFFMSNRAGDSIGGGAVIDEFSIEESLSCSAVSEGDSLSGRLIFHYWRSTHERVYLRDTLDVIGIQNSSVSVREAGVLQTKPNRHVRNRGPVFDLLGRKAGVNGKHRQKMVLVGKDGRTLELRE